MKTQRSRIVGGSVSPSAENRAESRHWAWAIVAALGLAFFLQGSRGLWEPDEGFYANVASGMATTGDWWIPRLNGEPFLDKPPLHYWGIAAGISVFGPTELGVRAANAMWFAGTALLVGLLAARLWGRRTGPLATLAYAVMLAPFIAANVLTPDTVLAFWVTAMTYAYWCSHTSVERRRRFGWTVVAGVCAGIGILAKGPALAVFALPLAIHGLVVEGLRTLWRLEVVVAAVLAAAIGGSWYVAVAQLLPGAASYFFDNQVAGRLWSDHYQRNAGLAGSIKVYLPALLAGSLPWSIFWPAPLTRLVRSVRSNGWSSLKRRPKVLLLLLWIAVPLAILGVAKSRLPLYILPALPAVALAAAPRLRRAVDDVQAPTGRSRPARLAAWVVLLLAIKGTAALWPSAKDTRRLAETLERLDVDPATPLFAIDLKCNALPLYGYTKLVQVRHWSPPYPFFSPATSLEAALARFGTDRGEKGERVFLVEKKMAASLMAELPSTLGSCRRLGSSAEPAIVACGRALPVAAVASGSAVR